MQVGNKYKYRSPVSKLSSCEEGWFNRDKEGSPNKWNNQIWKEKGIYGPIFGPEFNSGTNYDLGLGPWILEFRHEFLMLQSYIVYVFSIFVSSNFYFCIF